MLNIDQLTMEEFKEFPLVIEGESKEVRYAGDGLVVIRLKPTIYSFTANRCGVVEGSDILRLRATKIFLEIMRSAGIAHAYQGVNDRWILSRLVLQPATASNPNPFRPGDLSEDRIKLLPIAQPIETVVKRMHSGTSKHRYFGMCGHRARASHPFYAGMEISADGAYPSAIVRFDWRNPLTNASGKQLADEILPEPIADWFIDIRKATQTALKIYEALSEFLGAHDIVCYDLCLFIAEDGETVFGEISQDCGRFRHFDLGSLDKDVWRAGGSSQQVLEKWQTLLDLITPKGVVK